MNPNELRKRAQNLLATKRDWYRVENQAMGPTKVHIYDEIGVMGVTAKDLTADLGNITGQVELHINSPGGEIFDGIAIFNALSSRDVAVYIDGVAASAASFIAMAASPGKLHMAKNATMMIHDGQVMAAGDAAELMSLVDILERESKKIANIYAERTGKDADYWRTKMKATTWYDAEEALADGLVDDIFDPRTGEVVNRPQVVLTNKAEQADGWLWNADDGSVNGWRVRDGKWVFDPDNDGDDDSTPEGDSDHDYWDENGKQIKPIPPKPQQAPAASSATTVTNASVDDSSWDASKAWHNGSAAEDPEAFFRAICAGEKTSGDPKTQAHWALPYRYTPNSAPNKAAVQNALARLDSTQDLKDREGTRTKLQRLMKDINPDYQPSDGIDVTGLAALLTQGLQARHGS